jgi:hypothetical protein
MLGIVLEDAPELEETRVAVADALGFPVGTVPVFTSLEELEESEAADTPCVVTFAPGQFGCFVDVYGETGEKTDLEVAVAVSKAMACRVLVGEGGPNPYVWTLVDNGRPRPVKLDPIAHDDTDHQELNVLGDAEP